METCSNCGATIRPGAKFCTTCGTRLNDTNGTGVGAWGSQQTGTAETAEVSSSQQTQIAPAVAPAPPAQDRDTNQPGTLFSRREASKYSGWATAYSAAAPDRAPSSGDDPASRFISALDNDVARKPEPDVETTDATTEPDTDSDEQPFPTWETPAPDTFVRVESDQESAQTPEDEEPTEVAADDQDIDIQIESGGWQPPASWSQVPQPSEPEGTPDTAGFHDGGSGEVDYLSGDENVDVSPENAIPLPAESQEPRRSGRTELIAKLDELRAMLGEASLGTPDETGALQTLRGVQTDERDFSDLQTALDELERNPRDIDALRGLAERADDIQNALTDVRDLRAANAEAISRLEG